MLPRGLYEAVGKSDQRLSESAEGSRGCGGIGMIWRKSIGATPINGITSDRICGIRFTVDDGDRSTVSVIVVYLSCLDQGMDCNKEHLVELEWIIGESQIMGAVLVTGNFNAHIGAWVGWSERARGSRGPGVLLHEMMEKCNLSAVSLGSMASGPGYTYLSGESQTTVDYILMDVEAASMMWSCITHHMDHLNTSDHLPMTVKMMNAPEDQDHEHECQEFTGTRQGRVVRWLIPL